MLFPSSIDFTFGQYDISVLFNYFFVNACKGVYVEASSIERFFGIGSIDGIFTSFSLSVDQIQNLQALQ